MPSLPPEAHSLEDAWEAEDNDLELASTRLVDSRELLAQAGFSADEAAAEAPTGSTGRITQPPPVPLNEYVATMMGQAPDSFPALPPVPRSLVPWEAPVVAEDFQGTLQGLISEDVELAFNFEDQDDVEPPTRQIRGRLPAQLDLEEFSSEELRVKLLRTAAGLSGEVAVIDEIEELDMLQGPNSGAETVPAPDPDARLTVPDFEPDSALQREARRPLSYPELGPEAAQPGQERAVSAAFAGFQDNEELRWDASAPAPAEAPRAAEVHERPTIPGPQLGDQRAEMRYRFEMGDYSGALVLAEAFLDEDPADAAARRYAEACADMLQQMYVARIGEGGQVLRVAMPSEQLRSLSLDHRTGFLLSCIDGYSSIDEILDVSGMPHLEALRLLYELVQENVVACDGGPRSPRR